MVKCTASLISLSSVNLFVSFPNSHNYCCQQMQGAYKMCTVMNTVIPVCDWHLLSSFNVTPESIIEVMRMMEMIVN